MRNRYVQVKDKDLVGFNLYDTLRDSTLVCSDASTSSSLGTSSATRLPLLSTMNETERKQNRATFCGAAVFGREKREKKRMLLCLALLIQSVEEGQICPVM